MRQLLLRFWNWLHIMATDEESEYYAWADQWLERRGK